MKVLNIYKSYYPYSIGGVEKHIENLSNLLHAHNVQNDILTTSKEKIFSVQQVGKSRVYYFPSSIEIASCPMSWELLKQFRSIATQYDILHFHFPWPFADLLLALCRVQKPIIVYYHSDIIRQKWLNIFYQPLMHHFLKKADLILTSSENYLNSSLVLQRYQHKTKVIPFGLNIQNYPSVNQVEINEWRQRVGSNFFLFVGVLRYYKGLNYLLEAVEGTNIEIVIAGSGPEELALKKLKNEKKLENVTFVGKISEKDKLALYQLCKASIFPSHLRTEAFCISILESLMLEKPIISTELGTGTSFVNTNGISGLVVPPADSAALKKAMLMLLNDSTLYENLKRGTKIHYQQHFTAEKMRDSYLQIIKNYSK